jgi:hypothetical protein
MRSLDYHDFLRRVQKIATDLGRKAGLAAVAESRCSGVELMGSYEREHFGIADFEPDFSERLEAVLDRARDSRLLSREIRHSVWTSWVDARNRAVRERCPNARVAGED